MIGANTLVQTAILQSLLNNSNRYFENRIAPVYQETYTQDSIYSNLKDGIGFIVILPLLLIYLRQTSSMLIEKEVTIHLFRQKLEKACTLSE
jgi:hypothetical protein